jgi:hypothetical protein
MTRTDRHTPDPPGRRYIPAPDFGRRRERMQRALDAYIAVHPCAEGYFIVVQMDDGPLLRVPVNTRIYGACTGDVPIPLIYQDRRDTLVSQPRKSFHDKTILCSFVGSNTHPVRTACIDALQAKPGFAFHVNDVWTNRIESSQQDRFVRTTLDSRFALAPRGYGRSSFRFFEILQLGAIPVYVWDDIEWLPYQERLDYGTFCISIHVSNIDSLATRLADIDERTYNAMLGAYDRVKHMFALEYLCDYIAEREGFHVARPPIASHSHATPPTDA